MMTEIKEVPHTKCGRCRCYRTNEKFLNAKGRRMKTCLSCRNRYKCDKCEYKCCSNGNLKAHIKKIHDKIKDFKCDKCEYRCCTKGNLKAHIKQVHDKIKDVKCEKCEYKCATNGNLQQHIKIVHDKIKDFECDNCEFSCSTKGHLQRHIKQVHDKIKDRKCEKCSFASSTNSGLQRHIKICTGEINCSSGEYQIMKTLDEMRVKYEYDQSHELKNDKDNWLRWDFIIASCEPLFIEYDGRQHFKAVERFGGDESFEKQKKHDKLKDDYCNENAYLLLRIPYTEYENIHQLVVKFIRDNTDWGYE